MTGPHLGRLPYSEEVERAVLAVVLLEPELHGRLAGSLDDEDFHIERHRDIWAAYGRLAESDRPIDLRTVQAALEDAGALQRVGGLAYLAGLDVDLPDLSRWRHYRDLLVDRSGRRALVQAAEQVIHDAGTAGARELAARVEGVAKTVGYRAVGSRLRPWDDCVASALDQIERRAGESSPSGLMTGIDEWDMRALGLHGGELGIVAGPTGHGKSVVGLYLAAHTALTLQVPTAIFSLEMSAGQVAERILAAWTGVGLSEMRAGRLSDAAMNMLYAAEKQLKDAPLHICDDMRGLTPTRVAAECRGLKADGGLGLVVVDYLQLLEADGRYANRNLEIGSISRSLKQLAVELEVPVVALSQLSRGQRGPLEAPQLKDLRDSGALEQDADFVLFVQRPELIDKADPSHRGVAWLYNRKHRSGPSGYDIELVFDGPTASIRPAHQRAPW
ncbi:MAG: DnaB-like helicase C-terminal domain-containing protein [Acidobacteriota bacterium]